MTTEVAKWPNCTFKLLTYRQITGKEGQDGERFCFFV